MAMIKSQKAPRTGTGALKITRGEEAVAFSILLTGGLGGRKTGKGSLTGEPEFMREAFRAGECRLTLDDGVALNIAVVAHTDGGDTAYFELR